MLSVAQFRHRFRPFLALLAGGTVALSTFAVLYADAYRSAEHYVTTYSIERQVAVLLSGTTNTNRQWWFHREKEMSLSDGILRQVAELLPVTTSTMKEPFRHMIQRMYFDDILKEKYHLDDILNEKYKAKVATCVSEIKSLVNLSPDVVTPRLSIETRELLLQNMNCPFFETKISEWISISACLVSALLIGLSALLFTSIWSWVATYPHVGWRRFALVLGSISGAVAWIGVWWLDEYGFKVGTAVVVASATCVAAGLLVGLKAFEWVRHGFDAAGHKGEA
jgi:hypothetical protein